MIGRGRNFISCSSDGTARLWDSGKGELSTIVSHHEEINNCLIMEQESQTSTAQLALFCCEDGYLLGHDLRQKQQALQMKMKTAVNCCLDIESTIVVTGLHNGQLCVSDLRNTSSPLASYSKTDAPILDLYLHPNVEHKNRNSIPLWVANGEGDCSLFEIYTNEVEKDSSQPKVLYELSGVDTEYVTAVTGSNRSLFTASRDGIRSYNMSLISVDSTLENESNNISSTCSVDDEEEETSPSK